MGNCLSAEEKLQLELQLEIRQRDARIAQAKYEKQRALNLSLVTALDLSSRDKIETIQSLLDAGADPTGTYRQIVRKKYTLSGSTILYYAAVTQKFQIFKILIYISKFFRI